MTDQALVLFERHRDELEQHTKLAMADSQALRRVLDKRANLELARDLAVPCPRQFLLEDPGQIPEMIRALGFPIVIKRSSDPVEPVSRNSSLRFCTLTTRPSFDATLTNTA